MEQSHFLTRSLDFGDSWPCPKVFLHINGVSVFWALDYLHKQLSRVGCDKQRGHWLGHFKNKLEEYIAAEQGPHVFIASSNLLPNLTELNVSSCSTLALVTFFLRVGAFCRILKALDAVCGYLTIILNRCLEIVPMDGVDIALPGGHLLHVDGAGNVTGFGDYLAAAHAAVERSLRKSWATMRETTTWLRGDYVNRDCVVSFRDIVVFLIVFPKLQKKITGHGPSNLQHSIWENLINAFVPWMVHYLDKVVRSNATSAAAPALNKTKLANGRAYVSVSPEAIWDLMELAACNGTSLRTTISVRNDDPAINGAHAGSCDLWVNKLLQMYNERAALGFSIGANHLSVVADGSMHSCKDTLASLAYSWELDLAAHLTAQIMPPGKDITHYDQSAMPSHIAQLCAERKLQRVAAWRQLQCLSNQIALLSKGTKTLDSFQLGNDVLVKVVPQDGSSVRIVRKADLGGIDTAMIVRDGVAMKVLPDGLIDVPLLVVGLDQGSIGAAGMAFAINDNDSMMHVKFDKFHRIIRDLKLSYLHCCKGCFQKAQLYSSYLWSLNYKPFGSGGFLSLKNRLLTTFLTVESEQSEIFLKYAELIAKDLGMPYESEADLSAVWTAVAELESFHKKQSLPKQGRWFSWNESCQENLTEYWPSRVIYEHHLGPEAADPDTLSAHIFDIHSAGKQVSAQAELAALRKVSGGISLAYNLMSSDLRDHVRILSCCTKACWDFYTWHVKEIKTPADGMRVSLAMSEGQWANDSHLWATLKWSLYDSDSLRFMGFTGLEDPSLAQKTLSLALHILSHRAWSLSRYDSPPDQFAHAASADAVVAERATTSMRYAWEKLVMLEQCRQQVYNIIKIIIIIRIII